MKTSIQNIWADYEETIAMLLDPLSPEDGDAEESVAAAEARLELALPALFREFYLRTARRKDINGASERLLPLDEIFVDQGYLVFYEENQCVCFWGVAVDDLALEDPPVSRGIQYGGSDAADSGISWSGEEPTFSAFLRTMLFWQCAAGLMECQGWVDMDAILESEKPGWRYHRGGGDTGIQAFWRDGQLLVLTGSSAVGCARTPSDLAAIETAFELKWDGTALKERETFTPCASLRTRARSSRLRD